MFADARQHRRDRVDVQVPCQQYLSSQVMKSPFVAIFLCANWGIGI
jgi:hypothetical protein